MPRLGEMLDPVVPISPELLLHVLIEVLLLPSLTAEHLLHMQTRLPHNLIEHSSLLSACFLLISLKLLERLLLSKGLSVYVALAHLLFNALCLGFILVIAFPHSLLLHLELILKLIEVLGSTWRFEGKRDIRGHTIV
jgi:hypothetical protein